MTGAAGFLGSHMVDRLLADGVRVRGIDLDSTRAAQTLAAAGCDSRFTFETCDLLNVDARDSLFAGAHYLFHFAGLPHHAGSHEDPERWLRVNVLGMARVLEAARHGNYEKVIYASSAAVYAPSKEPIRENDPIRPHTPHGLTKWMGEELADAWGLFFRVPILSFRIFNGYGPRGDFTSIVNAFIKKELAGEPLTLTGDGSQRRDFIYVSDIIDAFIRGAESEIMGGAFNLASGTLHTVLDVARLISDRIELAPKRANDPDIICPDISQIQTALSWRARIPLEEGVRLTLVSYGLLARAAVNPEATMS